MTSTLPFRVSTAIVLFAATIGKLVGEASHISIFALTVDVTCGAWLLSGWQRAGSLTAVTALFAIYTGYNIGSVWLGDEVCGCLGGLLSSPKHLLALDVLILVLGVNSLTTNIRHSFQLAFPLTLLVSGGIFFKFEFGEDFFASVYF